MDLIPGSRYTSAAGASMADAYLSEGDDVASGLFYNPALLGKIRVNEFSLLNASFYLGPNLISNIGSIFQAPNLSAYASALDQSPQAPFSFGGAVLPTIGFYGSGWVPSISIGLLLQSQNTAQSNGDKTYKYRNISQFIPTLGFGYRWLRGRLKLGYSVQWVNQASGSAQVAAADLQSYTHNLSQGSSVSHNLGISYTIQNKIFPAFNFVLRNAFGAIYHPFSLISFASDSPGPPPTEPPTMDAAFSVHPQLGFGASVGLTAELRDISNQANAAWPAHFALGAELRLSRLVVLRAGWGGGYPAAGIGFRDIKSELALVWSSEEIGGSYLAERDVRYLLQYKIVSF